MMRIRKIICPCPIFVKKAMFLTVDSLKHYPQLLSLERIFDFDWISQIQSEIDSKINIEYNDG